MKLETWWGGTSWCWALYTLVRNWLLLREVWGATEGFWAEEWRDLTYVVKAFLWWLHHLQTVGGLVEAQSPGRRLLTYINWWMVVLGLVRRWRKATPSSHRIIFPQSPEIAGIKASSMPFGPWEHSGEKSRYFGVSFIPSIWGWYSHEVDTSWGQGVEWILFYPMLAEDTIF